MIGEVGTESPVSTPAAAGGSRAASTPASAPAGTSVSHGTASAALIAAAEASERGAGSSPATTPAGAAGDPTKPGATPDGTTPAGATQPVATDPAATQPGGARNPELEAKFTSVARNAQTKVLQALGLGNVTYQQLPEVAKELRTAFEMLADFRKNPADFVSRVTAHLEANGGGKPKPFAFPDGRLRAEDGTQAYSAPQVQEILQEFKKEIQRDLLSNGALQNVISYVDKESQQREEDATTRRNQETVTSVLTEARALPHFKENEADIVNLIAAWRETNPVELKRRGVAWAVHAAYNQVLTKKVYGPSYESGVEARIREEYKKKAAGGGLQIDPNVRGGDGKKPELSNVSQLAAHMEKLAAAG